MSDKIVNTLPQQRRHILVAAGVLILLLATLLVRQAGAGPLGDDASPAPLMASGIIGVEEVSLASELGGRISSIPISAGMQVAEGETVARLSTAVVDAQIEAARAMIAIAEAGLARAKAGASSQQVAVAEAQLVQAEAGRSLAQQAVTDTRMLLENPQDIDLRIAVAQAQLESARHKTAQAAALKSAAEMGKGLYEYVRDHSGRQQFLAASGPLSQLPPEIAAQFPVFVDGVYDLGEGSELHVHGETFDLYQWVDVHVPNQLLTLSNDYWLSWIGLNAAVAEEESIESSLNHLHAVSQDPQEMEAAHEQAVYTLAEAEAMVAQARIQVDAMKTGATEEQILAAEARVSQAQAVLRALMTQRELLCIETPMDGSVTNILVHEGEVAAPGASLLTIADLSQVTLTVYVAENRIGLVHLNQQVQVTVDSFPDRDFEARVSHISNHAEFTPRNVATQEERVNLVFAVEITILNEDGTLKPGMPADAVLED